MLKILASEDAVVTEEIIETFSPSDILSARERFQLLKDKNVLVGNFDDSEWVTYDGVRKRHIIFNVEKENYNKELKSLLKIEYKTFELYIKVFAISLIGTYSMQYIKQTIKTICHITNNFQSEQIVGECSVFEVYLAQCDCFFDTVPADENGKAVVLNLLDEIIENVVTETCKRLELRDFKNYYVFSKYLDMFWQEANTADKIHYFPVYFWWKVTTIIPTRVTEFTLTPLECLGENETGPTIKLRKTKGKKRYKEYRYNIDDDYVISEFPITREIADSVSWYIDATRSEKYKEPDNNTLFRNDTTYGNWRHLSSLRLNNLIKDFCQMILGERFKLNVILDEEVQTVSETSNETVEVIHANETRHIAMINALFSTHSLYICKTLAGHESVSTSAWYAENIERFVESSVFAETNNYGNGTSNKAVLLNLYKSIGLSETAVPLSTTESCVSRKAQQHDYDDCFAVSGRCEECKYYRNTDPTVKKMSSNAIKEEMEFGVGYLKYAIDSYRKGWCNDDSVEDALARIKKDALKYRHHCIEDIIEQERKADEQYTKR